MGFSGMVLLKFALSCGHRTMQISVGPCQKTPCITPKDQPSTAKMYKEEDDSVLLPVLDKRAPARCATKCIHVGKHVSPRSAVHQGVLSSRDNTPQKTARTHKSSQYVISNPVSTIKILPMEKRLYVHCMSVAPWAQWKCTSKHAEHSEQGFDDHQQ